jgi:hypothetical protein
MCAVQHGRSYVVATAASPHVAAAEIGVPGLSRFSLFALRVNSGRLSNAAPRRNRPTRGYRVLARDRAATVGHPGKSGPEHAAHLPGSRSRTSGCGQHRPPASCVRSWSRCPCISTCKYAPGPRVQVPAADGTPHSPLRPAPRSRCSKRCAQHRLSSRTAHPANSSPDRTPSDGG